MSKLVIVESPAKAKTIGKYLGKDYEVTASMGHIRDLPASQLGIDVEHDYAPQYISIKGKEKLIKELKSKAKHSDGVILATDPDREGEAISWHLANILGLDPHGNNRVTFDEITKKGVQEGMAHPRAIDEDLFNAQQARRVLDRLVGYKLSPFLWRKVRRGLSAGRVQSVAVRIIDDREKEIENFKPEEYWNIDASFGVGRKTFTARLSSDAKGKKLLPRNEEEARAIEQGLQGAEYTVGELKKGKRSKQPTPAFITSTLQQEASRRLGFTATRTMRAAQTLYEGVDIAGHGTMGLITYMRTDSLRISDEAVAAAKEYIAGAYGENYICPYKRAWKTKSATAAQDAHEAIRPSVPSLTPDEVDQSISGDTAKLYRMIWSRFMASQMADCQQDTVSVTVHAGDYRFKASGYTVTFDGFTVLYEEATDEKEKKETSLPPLEQGQVLKLKELKSEQKFTQPPARYTEATLIKALEENGIGRPSTYAPIITTIIDRGYVEREQKKLKPTLLGRAVDWSSSLTSWMWTSRLRWRRTWIRWKAARPTGTRPWTTSIRGLQPAWSRRRRTWRAKKSRCRTSPPARCATCAAAPWSSRWASMASSWPARASRSAGAPSGWSRIPAASAPSAARAGCWSVRAPRAAFTTAVSATPTAIL